MLALSNSHRPYWLAVYSSAYWFRNWPRSGLYGQAHVSPCAKLWLLMACGCAKTRLSNVSGGGNSSGCHNLCGWGCAASFAGPGRTTFTLVALTLSGAIFLAVQMGNVSLGLAVTTESSPIAHPDVRIDMNAGSQQAVAAIRSLSNVQSAVPVTFGDAILGENRLFLT